MKTDTAGQHRNDHWARIEAGGKWRRLNRM